MAHSKDTLLDRVAGSVSNLTFYQLNNRPVVRQKATKIANPQTIKQQANRSNIELLIDAFRTLRPILILALNNRPKSRSAYNEFFARNLNHSFVNGQFHPGNFQVSTADIPGTDFQANRLTDESNKFTLSWDAALTGNQREDDLLCAVIHTFTNNQFGYAITNTNRQAQHTDLEFKLQFHTAACTLYLFFVRQNFAESSVCSIQTFDAIN